MYILGPAVDAFKSCLVVIRVPSTKPQHTNAHHKLYKQNLSDTNKVDVKLIWWMESKSKDMSG